MDSINHLRDNTPVLKILVLYNYPISPPRKTIWDHLYSFKNYSKHKCFYLNTALGHVPGYLKKIKFDLIIFHTTFLSKRSDFSAFERLMKKVEMFKSCDSIKIVFPQDEFMNTKVLCRFINDFKVKYVFTVAPESEWKKIYSDVDFNKVQFYNILTGYLDDKTLTKIDTISKHIGARNIDIGYRAWRAAPWLGRHGYLKKVIADIINEKAIKAGLNSDISTRDEDTIFGDDWYRFLCSCKYTIGVEGGASILDAEGKIKAKTDRYLHDNPDATFEEIEKACFPGLDGTLHLFAISPRHLEACATRTCQILVKGKYNGILVPGRHYIELETDLSNIDDVLEIVKNDNLRYLITENAYKDIVQSHKFTYRSLVNFVLNNTMAEEIRGIDGLTAGETFIYYFMHLDDYISWVKFFILNIFLKVFRILFPEDTIKKMIELYKKI